MKRFAVALFFAIAHADGHEREDETSKDKQEDQLADSWEANSGLFSSKQEP